ncbi:MAG: TonB-dependent receptor, partial [Gammaproteobacteria bacterium]
LNINGSRTQDNLITFDGAVAVRTRSNGTSIGVADLDSTQEVQIMAANYTAEYGRSAGGQIRIVTKSGTPQLHGVFYEYLRNSALNANSFNRNRLNTLGDKPCAQFSKEDHCRPSPFRYNQFGYNLNGPVVLPGLAYNRDRGKLFWLWGQEWVRQRAASTSITTVPSVAMRNGDFSELLSASNRFYNAVRVINDPLTNTPFPNNIIPTSRLSANGTGFLKAYPAPTPGFIGPGTANFTQTRPTLTNQRKDTLSIDWYPSERHQIRWRAQLFNFVDVSAFRANTDRAPQIIDRPNQTTSINWVWSMSPTMTSELLATGSRDQVYIAVDTREGKHKRSLYGINYQYIFSDPKEISDKIPTVNFGGVFTDLDGGPYPAQSTGPIYNVAYHITKIR